MSFDWNKIADGVVKGVDVLAPVIAAAMPEAAAIAAIINKIVDGLAAAEPAAIALYEQIKSGTPPTTTQLAAYYATYQADDDALKVAIQQHLDALNSSE